MTHARRRSGLEFALHLEMPKSFYSALSLVLFLFLSANAHGEFISFERKAFYDPAEERGFSFVVPNELRPQDALPIWRDTIPGVYVSVGSERGFIGAAFSNATHLLLLDQNPKVVRFNRINILLLKGCAGDAKLFRRVRTSARYLREHLENLRLTPEERAFLRAETETEWWNAITKSFSKHFFWEPLKQRAQKTWFVGTHYVEDPQAFAKLTQMATEGLIQTEQVELRPKGFMANDNITNVESVIKAWKLTQLNLSVLDISNAWEKSYLGEEDTTTLIRMFSAVSYPESRMVLTMQVNTLRTMLNSRFGQLEWDYLTATMHEFLGADRASDESLIPSAFVSSYALPQMKIGPRGSCEALVK